MQAVGVEWFADTAQMLAAVNPDGVIIANPNTLHVSTALTCLAAGVPVLLEKPVGVDLAEVRTLLAASRDSGVPVLVGHHRRHNPLIVRAHELVLSFNALEQYYQDQGRDWERYAMIKARVDGLPSALGADRRLVGIGAGAGVRGGEPDAGV